MGGTIGLALRAKWARIAWHDEREPMNDLRWLYLILGVILLAACARPSESTPGPAVIVDVGTLQPGEPPAEYRNLRNPYRDDPDARARGAEAYQALCSQCHGPTGVGDGPDAQGLSPAPSDLTAPGRVKGLSDGYLYWRIAEGGAFPPFNSLMPAWGTLLSESEIWELVSYLRTLGS